VSALDGGFEIVVDVRPQRFTIASGMAKKKINVIRERENELRANLLQLSEACPFHLANPEDCPLFQFRRMKPTKRLQWVNALSESDLAYLATYHRVCFRIKVESGSAKQRTKAPAKKGSSREAAR
jgi:hypothetical protein